MKNVLLVLVMTLFSGIAFTQSFKKDRPGYEKESISKVQFYRNTSFLKMKGVRAENQFATMFGSDTNQNLYPKRDGRGSFNRSLLNNFKLQRQWDKSRNKCY